MLVEDVKTAVDRLENNPDPAWTDSTKVVMLLNYVDILLQHIDAYRKNTVYYERDLCPLNK